ncbi:MAG: selenocysteine-specific translation elongation factor [Thermoflexales bacterium]|nr:selenocysteine-specific translation elongation factor [Thermoflexales bacterium]
MKVLATAGHVDHGKSSLVRALTGIDPDRLKEERAREMTIDLGFASLNLPGGEQVGVIDVPGHIDFIENMLAGVGGIDAALLVIAADEGVMPQTREHIDILRLLRVPRAVVALSKLDLAPDPDWVALIGAEVRAALADAPFAEAEIIPVSVRTGAGLPDLTAALARGLAGGPPRPDRARARLPVDRVFAMTGFGPVVTGTLLDGSFTLGDEVDVLPDGLRARVRGLQTHGQKRERVAPGTRLAINLSGIELAALRRGQVIARADSLSATRRLDVELELLRAPGSAAQANLPHNAEVKAFAGASETLARVRLLEGASASPGARTFAQLETVAPLVAVPGDRIILRLPSPSVTLGGGRVLDAHPAQRHRRRQGHAAAATLAHLRALADGRPRDRLESALAGAGITTRAALLRGQDGAEAATALDALLAEGVAEEIGTALASRATWEARQAELLEALRAHHLAAPLQLGMNRESARARLGLDARAFAALVGRAAAADALTDDADTLRARGHVIAFTPGQQRQIDGLLRDFAQRPLATPSPRECRGLLGDAVYEALLRLGTLKQVSAEVVVLPVTYAAAVAQVRALIGERGTLTAAELRDALGASRKYALALLEHLDETGVTRRVGDARVLR